MSKYKPSTKEVLKEIGKDIGNGFKKVGKGIGYGVGTFVYASAVPYFIPTQYRKIKDDEDSIFGTKDTSICSKLSDTEFIGVLMGSSTGLIGTVVQTIFYGAAAYQGYPEFLVIPATTNLCSGLYEKYRNTEKKLMEKEQSSVDPNSLEEKIEEKCPLDTQDG